ncbi:hypothetical protein QZH41_009691, partial [Actinostola sp. cb2023]
PGRVQFEVEAQPRPGSGGARCGSAGRVERKLQVLKKREEVQDEAKSTSSSDDRISTTQHSDKLPSMTANNVTPPNPKTLLEEKPKANKQLESDQESSEESSESDSDDSDSESEKTKAPIEMKGEFMKYVMDEDYEKAKELCQKILLLEPDNTVCIEFHGLIVQKLEQEKSEESSSDEDSDDDDDDDEEDDDKDQEDDDDDETTSDEESESDSDDDFTVPPGLNLIMGGLPIKPQTK